MYAVQITEALAKDEDRSPSTTYREYTLETAVMIEKYLLTGQTP